MDSIYLLLFGFFSFSLICFVVVLLINDPKAGWAIYILLLGILPFLWELYKPDVSTSKLLAFSPIFILTVLIGIFSIFYQFIAFRTILYEKGPLFISFAMFIGSCIVSLVNANDFQSGLTMTFTWIYLFFCYYIVYNSITSFKTIVCIINLYIIVLLLLSGYGAFVYIMNLSPKGVNPYAVSRLLESNHFAFILIHGIYLSLFMGAYSLTLRRLKIYYLISFVLMLIALAYTQSRGAWVSFLFSLAALYIFVAPAALIRSTWIKFAMTVGIFLAVSLYISDTTLQGRILSIFSGEKASASRIEMDNSAFEVFRTHPIIGVGIDNFEVYIIALKKVSSGTCNLYSRVLVESGLLGLTSFLIFMLHIFRTLLKGVKAFPLGSREYLIQVAFLGGFLANAIDFFFFGLVFPFPWIFFFFGTASAKFANSYYYRNVLPITIFSSTP